MHGPFAVGKNSLWPPIQNAVMVFGMAAIVSLPHLYVSPCSEKDLSSAE